MYETGAGTTVLTRQFILSAFFHVSDLKGEVKLCQKKNKVEHFWNSVFKPIFKIRNMPEIP